MPRWLLPFVAAVVVNSTLAGAARLAAQLPPDKALASMRPADGLQVELFAAEPMLLNPTSMDVDHLGRVWVCEAVNYRRKMFKKPLLRPEGDRIVVLTDRDGDGRADESTVFYQGEDLYGPLGIAVVPLASGGRQPAVPNQQQADARRSPCKVFVCQSPDILLFHDADGDGKADGPPEKFLAGFGGFDHDHGVHGILVGPDGKLYFTVGDSGVTGLQSRDGKGRKWVTTRDPKGDCQAGTVWRCDLDGTNLELIAHNFRNNYEACVDSFGEIWLSDNDDDGNQQTRICHVLPGGNYGYWPRGAGQTHWHEEQPGIVHKTLRTGFGSPTGITFYEGTLLPEKYRGHLLHTDAGPRELRCFHRKPKGAGYELDKTLMLTSSDNWFRPSDVCVAPDGSVFVADWYDPGVGGHGMGDWTRGRVYRVTPKGHAGYTVPEVKLDTKEGMLAALASPCLATRALAIEFLRSTAKRESLDWLRDGAAKADQPFLQARSYWQAAMIDGQPGFAHVAKGNWKWEGNFSELAVRLMKSYGATIAGVKEYKPLGPDRGPADYRELLISLRDIEPAKAAPYILELARYYDGKDHFYRAALNIACGTDPRRRDAILADFDRHFPDWDDRTADLVWELRPKSVLPRLERLLADAGTPAARKGRIVDILAANDDPAAGRAVLALLTADQPAEVKARALENLRLFLPTKWKELLGGKEFGAALDTLLAGEATRTTALELIAAAGAADRVAAVRALAAADAPTPIRAAAVHALGKLPTREAVEALRALLADKAVAPEAVAALAEQVGNRRNPNPAAQQALAALQGVVTDANAPADLRRGAVEALAGTRAGTGWLLGLKEKNQFPEALAADAGRLLRNSPFQGERNKALLLFPAPGKLDPKKLPPITELAKRRGNPANGQQLMAKSSTSELQCLKCHMVRGQGGQIGPDLSMVGKKGSRENLFESVLQPSKAIAQQYESWKIDTEDGQSITGLLVGETETTLTIRDANGKDHNFPAKGTERKKLLVSLMPDNLAAALTEDELVDLVEYMTTLQTAALTPSAWHVAGPFPAAGGGLDRDYGPEKLPFDPKAKFPAGGGTPSEVVWRPVRTGAAGYIDLRAFHGEKATGSVSYVYAEVESPADQEATVLLGTDDGAKLFVNGERVFATTATRAAAPEQDAAKVRLKKGANTVLLKIANGDGPHGFYLTLLSGQELKAK